MSRDLPSPFSLPLGTTDERASVDDETTTLFRTLSWRVRWLLRGFGPDVAQDATQEAFFRLHRARYLGEHIDNPAAWVKRVARHAAIDRVRRSRLHLSFTGKVTRLFDAEHDGRIETPEQRCWHRQRLARFKQAYSNLSKLEQQCLLMRAEGFTFTAIGTHLGMDFRRVAELVHRAIRKLKAACDADPPSS